MASRVIALPTCSICQDDEGGLDIISTMCGHTFHSDCIRQWDANQRQRRFMTKCPACNVELRKPVGADPTQSRFIRLHSLTERYLSSTLSSSSQSPNQQQQEVEADIRMINCQHELRDIKEVLRQRDLRIQELGAEPESLKRENETLNTTIRLLKQMQRDMEDRRAKCLRDLKNERQERQTERASHLQEIGRLKSEIERQSEKLRALKGERDELQEQLSLKVAENEELQSFVTDFSIEKARFQAVESNLRSQLQDSAKQAQTLRVANHAFNRKLEEAKKKIASWEGTGNSSSIVANRSTSSSRLSRSVQHCSKFYPDGSKPPILSTHAIHSSSGYRPHQSSSGTATRDREAHHKRTTGGDTPRRLSSQSDQIHKRFCASTRTSGKQPKVIEIKSDSDDFSSSSSSSPHLFSSPMNRSHQVDKDLILPSLFGDGGPSSRKSRLSTSLNQSTSKLRDSNRFNDRKSSVSGLNFAPSSGKLISIGPKIRHR